MNNHVDFMFVGFLGPPKLSKFLDCQSIFLVTCGVAVFIGLKWVSDWKFWEFMQAGDENEFFYVR